MWWGPWQPAGGMGLEHGPGPRRASLLEVLAPRFSRKGPWGEVSYHRTRGRGGVEGRTLSEAQSGSCSLSGCNNVLSWGGGADRALGNARISAQRRGSQWGHLGAPVTSPNTVSGAQKPAVWPLGVDGQCGLCTGEGSEGVTLRRPENPVDLPLIDRRGN